MKTPFLKALICLLLIPALVLSCTTSDDGAADESVEGELNSELDDIDNVEDGTVAEGDTDVNDSEFDDFENDSSGGGSTADSGGSEDDEFFAEDADKPAGQDMAEKDLQQELEKDGDAGMETAATQPPPVQAVEPAATSTPPPSGGGGGAVAGGGITSKESPITSDGFEPVTPPTLQMPKDDLGISDPLVADVDPPLPAEKAAKEVVPVSKIGKDPFFKNQRLMNTVYIARQGDDPGSISEKLFGKDNVSMLMADNPRMSEGVSVGDKVYYTSTNRPDDKKEILTYYEDKKIPAQYYTTKEGDNIQKIGRELLGHDDAWKEIWATNDLQTQALLPAGIKLRYWSGGETVAPPIEPPPMASTEPSETSGAATGTTSNTPPPSDPPSDNLPDLSEVAQTDDPASLPPETTPMPTDIATSAPTAPPVVTKESGDSLLMVAGIALVGLALIAMVAIQIKNRKKDDGAVPPSMEFTKV